MRHAKKIGILLSIAIIVGMHFYMTEQNSQFNSLIGQYPHALGGIFTGNSTYYEYYQVNASGEERYYLVVRTENGKVLKIREISYSDYLTYTGRALDLARSYVAGKLPQDAVLITYNVTNLTVRLYYSIGNGEQTLGNGERTQNSSTITSTLPSTGREFIIATVDLSSGNVTLKEVSFDELPGWVQAVVRVLSRE
ncbi:hypothetical protein [Thermococcus sp.]